MAFPLSTFANLIIRDLIFRLGFFHEIYSCENPFQYEERMI